MKESKFRKILGAFVIFLNLIMMFFVSVLYYMGGFDSDQLTTVLAIIFPMFSCYVGFAISHITEKRPTYESESDNIPTLSLVLYFTVPIICTLAILTVIYLQARGDFFKNFESFKIRLLLADVFFSFFVGQTFSKIYGANARSTGGRSAN